MRSGPAGALLNRVDHEQPDDDQDDDACCAERAHEVHLLPAGVPSARPGTVLDGVPGAHVVLRSHLDHEILPDELRQQTARLADLDLQVFTDGVRRRLAVVV